MAARDIETEDGSRNESKNQNVLRAEKHEHLTSTSFGSDNASVATKLSQNQQDDGDVLLNQDIFWHMFDFLRFDALITCKLLSRDVSRRAHQRMMNNDNVWQTNDIVLFCLDFLSEAINHVVEPKEGSTRCLIGFLNNRFKPHRKIDGNMPIKDVQFSFQDEWAFCIALKDRILKRMKVRPGIHNACKLFMKINKEIAATMDSFNGFFEKCNIDGYCSRINGDDDWHYLFNFYSSDDVRKSVSFFNKKIIQNDIDVDIYLNYENGSDNHDADDVHDDVNDHPHKKRKTKRSTRHKGSYKC